MKKKGNNKLLLFAIALCSFGLISCNFQGNSNSSESIKSTENSNNVPISIPTPPISNTSDTSNASTGTVIPPSIEESVSISVDEYHDYAKVSSFEDLKNSLNEKKTKILLLNDIEVNETLYVSEDTLLITTSDCVIKRSPTFLETMFVVGEDKDGNNPILSTGKYAKLTLLPKDGSTLSVDGNMDNISDIVLGTAFLLVNSGTLDIYDNVVLQNHKKLGNVDLEKYRVSYPEKIGGACIIIASGTFNMYGGTINNCQTSSNEDSTDISFQGGAIYNFGQFNMYGGTISNCFAERGGVLFNYKITNIYGGKFINNKAAKYGGVVYNPDSQYANLMIGHNVTDEKILLQNNSCEGSGGAIFSSISANILVNGNVEFDGNSATNNGGAINSPGSNVIKEATFRNNNAGSKGGAIYAYHNSSTETIRYTIIDNTLFEENESPKGGAISVGSSVDDYSYAGTKIYLTNCEFNKNRSEQGGALYFARQSHGEINDCKLIENDASEYGGGIYVTGKTTLIIKNIQANRNNATSAGGFMYATTAETTVKIASGEALDNTTSAEKGSTIWTNAKTVVLQIKGKETKEYFNYNGEILGKATVANYA